MFSSALILITSIYFVSFEHETKRETFRRKNGIRWEQEVGNTSHRRTEETGKRLRRQLWKDIERPACLMAHINCKCLRWEGFNPSLS
jgi:hypothetical protein